MRAWWRCLSHARLELHSVSIHCRSDPLTVRLSFWDGCDGRIHHAFWSPGTVNADQGLTVPNHSGQFACVDMTTLGVDLHPVRLDAHQWFCFRKSCSSEALSFADVLASQTPLQFQIWQAANLPATGDELFALGPQLPNRRSELGCCSSQLAMSMDHVNSQRWSCPCSPISHHLTVPRLSTCLAGEKGLRSGQLLVGKRVFQA